MDAIRLPNGNLIVPVRVESEDGQSSETATRRSARTTPTTRSG